MELGSGNADLPGESGFDIHVDVLELDGKLKVPARDLLLDLAQAGFDPGEFLVAEEPGLHLGPRVGDRARDIVRVQAPVIGDRLSVALNEVSSLLLKAALPHGREFQGGRIKIQA